MSDDAAVAGLASDDPTASDPHVLGPGLLPTPFTADEIRAASGVGKLIRLLVELPGGERFERVNRFSGCDPEGATLEQWRLDAAGDVDGAVTNERVTWLELQEHAAFPADHTERTTEVIESPLGTLECLRYATRHGDAGSSVSVFWFAPGYPGMPVRYEVPTPSGVVRTTVVSVEVER
ncbi:hypothetical protein PX701_00020 [Agromyces sp. H3Y2-19a]|uniref:hypothetical protein n=1 Tax=Agromyces TaxID=33877 RepID=UPI001E5EE685|nr:MULTISPECIES: hypothetical protein [Agromyces]MCD5345625.1 hypothetical protein [Agromyces sp. S2-1-8]MDF0511991.1 hypothetical protein [Agromyces chromiiresistens]